MPQIIPITSDASSTFKISLNDQTYTVVLKFNTRGGNDLNPYWTLDLFLNGENLFYGAPVVLGSPLLRYLHSDIGELIIADTENSGVEPGFTTLGVQHVLLYYPPEELADA